MTDHERFRAIVAQLENDRRWARRIRWLRVTGGLVSLGMRALASAAPAATTWVL